MKLSKLFGLALGVTVAGGLVATTVAGPTAPADEATMLMQSNKSKAITVSGVAIGTDGEPAAKLPVKLMAVQPPKQAGGGSGPGGLSTYQATSDKYKVIGKAVTDADGKFTFKNVKSDIPVLRLEIGDKMRTDWAIKPLNISDGKDKNMGEVKLEASLRRQR